MLQMVHTTWTARDGAPQALTRIAEGPDGRLWLAGSSGLYTFDGKRFTRFVSPVGEPEVPSGSVRTLCVTRGGAVWAGVNQQGLVRIEHGHVKIYKDADGEPLSTIRQMVAAPDGEVWAINRRESLIRFDGNGRWRHVNTPIAPAPGSPPPMGLFVDSSGTLWVLQGHLFRRAAGSNEYSQTAFTGDFFFGAGEAPDGSLWMSTVDAEVDKGATVHFDREGDLLGSLAVPELNDLLPARDGSLWMATQDDGLVRLPNPDLPGQPPVAPLADKFRRVDGLASREVESIIQDSDGNIWTAGERGLDRFRAPRLVPFRPDLSSHWTVCASPDGTTWLAAQARHLFSVTGDSVSEVRSAMDIYSLTCYQPDSALTLDHSGLLRYRAGKKNSIPLMPGAKPYDILQVDETRNGDMYALASVSMKGQVWQRKGREWRQIPSSFPGFPSAMTLSGTAYVDSNERLWIGHLSGRSGLVENGAERQIPNTEPNIGLVCAFAETTHGVMAAGLTGVAMFKGGSFRRLVFAQPERTQGVTGMVQSGDGDLWLNTVAGIVRAPALELEAAVSDIAHPIQTELVQEGEYVGPAPLRNGMSTATRDKSGKLWFVMQSSVVSLDPTSAFTALKEPRLSVSGIDVDGKPLGADRKVRPHPANISIRYFGLSLTAPERVIYRIKMEGASANWQDVGSTAEAIFLNLPPGRYTFHVMASFGDGRWTPTVAAETFTVLPAYYQSRWFYALCGVVFLVLTWLMYFLRLRQVGVLIKARAEERANERVRIARDLHDTLLQSVQGLLLSFHLAARKLPATDELRGRLDKALQQAEQVILEGRDRVTQLRSGQMADHKLIEHFEAVCLELGQNHSAKSLVLREGTAATLHPHIADEVFNIGREALTNAFHHAEASQIVLTLCYGAQCFTLTCQDDGKGFEDKRLEGASKQGHWGMHGMKERALRTGGSLQVHSKAGDTRIQLEVRSSRAYVQRSRLAFLLSRHT